MQVQEKPIRVCCDKSYTWAFILMRVAALKKLYKLDVGGKTACFICLNVC